VLELRTPAVTVITVLASSTALDGLARGNRIAPDEAMLVGDPGTADALTAVIADAVIGADPDALIVNTTDGWAVLEMAGSGAREAFSRLSHLELPVDGAIQGDVAHVPVRVVANADTIRLFVPAMWGYYVRERILAVGAAEVGT
jgi:hypothetical protein